MKINKAALLKALRRDLKSAEVLKNEWTIKIQEWKNAYEGKPYGNEQKGKSAIISRDIKKQSEWQHASIITPFVEGEDIITCKPITYEDVQAARQNELLLNTQFCRKFDRFNFMTKAVKVLDREGTLVVQTGWDYEDEEVEVEREVVVQAENGMQYVEMQTVTETVVKKNQPTAKVCRNEDIYFDPTCQDNLDNAQFVIYRYETDLSTLRQDGRYKNLEKVARSGDEVSYDYDYRPEDETRFQFEDAARRKVIVYEYWGNYDINEDGIAEPIVCAWVNDIIIRLQSNPYPDKKPPFVVVPMYSVPFQMHGEANAELIGDNQKIKTAIFRGIIDNMAQSNNGQVAVQKGALDMANRKKFLKGENFEYQGSKDAFWQGSYNQIPGTVFDVIGLMNNEIESLTGVKSFSGGINSGSLGATATGARGAMDATSTRRMNIVRNLSENLVKPLLRKWMAYNAEFLEAEEVVRVTNDEFVPVRRDDLAGQIDIDISVSTSEDNAAKAQELSFLLQTLGPNEDPAIRREIMAEIMDLMRMPEQAKRMREYQPQPDPMQEQAKQLELLKLQKEIEKMDADIADKYARAGENEVDRELKLQKARETEAKTRVLNSKADLDDLNFLKEDEGVKHAEQMELEELREFYRRATEDRKHQQKMEIEDFKRRANLDQMAFQAMQGDSNLGVQR